MRLGCKDVRAVLSDFIPFSITFKCYRKLFNNLFAGEILSNYYCVMMLFIANYRKVLIAQALALFFLINGMFILTLDVTFTGILFIAASCIIFGYVVLFLFRNKKKDVNVFLWKRKQDWYVFGLIGVLYLIGAIECFFRNETLALILAASLAFTFLMGYVHYRNRNEVSERKPIFFNTVLWVFSGILLAISLMSIVVYTIEVKLNGKKEVVLFENNEDFLIQIVGYLFVVELLIFVLINAYIHFRTKLTNQKEAGFIVKLRIFGLGFFWLSGIAIIITVLIADAYRLKIEYIEYIVPIFFMMLCFLGVYWLFGQIKSIIKLKNEQAKIELMHLQSQVNPHFFFNMLNNLYGWVAKDSKKAQELILKLSDMMRYSIYDGQKNEVTLGEEVEYLKNYIELHKMRYHKEIDIKFNTVIENDGIKLMPLLFIILLENAFKHGVENLRENAYVIVTITAAKKGIQFMVENNFDTTIKAIDQGGIGLKNLRRRLELVYPKQHSLSFSIIKNIYKTTLTLELE